MNAVSDEELLRRVAQRDQGAFALLYDSLGKQSYSLAHRILGDDGAAADVVQEVFLNVWRMASSFNPTRGGARTWVLSMVHHRAIDVIRQRRRQPALHHAEELLSAHPAPGDVWHDAAQLLDRDAIRKAMAQIPDEQRQAIEMAYFGGYTQGEIASLLEVPLGTVKGRIRIGVEKLRRLLKGQWVES